LISFINGSGMAWKGCDAFCFERGIVITSHTAGNEPNLSLIFASEIRNKSIFASKVTERSDGGTFVLHFGNADEGENGVAYEMEFADAEVREDWLSVLSWLTWKDPTSQVAVGPPASLPRHSTAQDFERAPALTLHTRLWMEKEVTNLAGVAYLTASPFEGEFNLGIVLESGYQGKGIGGEAINKLLTIAFDEFGAQRVQALVMDGPGALHAMNCFTARGLTHEGTRRRLVRAPPDNTWRDVTTLSLVVTDWLMRTSRPPVPRTAWEALFARQEVEHETLLKQESRVRRTRSQETIRDLRELAATTPTVIDNETDTDAGSQADTKSLSDAESSWDEVSEVSDVEPLHARMQRWANDLDTIRNPKSISLESASEPDGSDDEMEGSDDGSEMAWPDD